MFSKLCKSSLFPSMASSVTSHNDTRNDYHLPSNSIIQQSTNPRHSTNFRLSPHRHRRREPPPPYSFLPPVQPTIAQNGTLNSIVEHDDSNNGVNVSNNNDNNSLNDNNNRSDNEGRALIAGTRQDSGERSNDTHREILSVTDGPDLVSTCAGILDVENSDSDQEYEEIQTFLSEEFPKLSIHDPSLPSDLNRTEGVMGQNISLRRPRISLTWVLRENVSQSNPQPSGTLPDHKRSSQSPQKERMFSENYVSDQKSTENQKIQYDKYPNGRNAYLSHDHNNDHIRKLPRNRSDLDKSQLGVNVHQASSNYTLPDLKKTTSVPALSTKSYNGSELSVHDGQKRRRRRRDRGYTTRRFGYEINNVEEFLSKCSLASPANIPVVVVSKTLLYQTHPNKNYQIEIPLQPGMVVNSVFKKVDWLYVQTAHAEEGYIKFDCCLPLGILPTNPRSNSATRPQPCWENNRDVFPNPCGNMTDSEKELKLRTRSEGRRTPRLKRNSRACSEKNLDTLYLKVASQPKHVEYAQLKPTNKLQANMDYLTKATSDYMILQKLRTPKPSYLDSTALEQQASIRQTLVAITEDYRSDQLSVVKGDVVTLVACKSYQQKGSVDYQQWFFIRNRDGTEGYIPAKVAGHGFL